MAGFRGRPPDVRTAELLATDRAVMESRVERGNRFGIIRRLELLRVRIAGQAFGVADAIDREIS